MPEDFRNIHEGLSVYVKAGTTIFLLLAGLFLFFIANSLQRKRKLLARQKELETKHQQSLLQTQIEIQEQTLKTISQEIHDNVGQALSLAKLNLGTLHINTGISPQQKIESSIQLISRAINNLRDLSRSINGEKIWEWGLVQSIQNEIRIIQNTGAFTATFIAEGESYKLTPKVEMVAFRIVQEALHNAMKHSRASNIQVKLQYHPTVCSICIKDDGRGFDTGLPHQAAKGIGIKNMQSRASLIHAALDIESTASEGTCINLSINR